MRQYYGLSRSRDKKGRIVKRNLVPYTMCLHTCAGGGRDTMMVLVVEVDEEETENITGDSKGVH
jgi:hypothetical protein